MATVKEIVDRIISLKAKGLISKNAGNQLIGFTMKNAIKKDFNNYLESYFENRSKSSKETDYEINIKFTSFTNK